MIYWNVDELTMNINIWTRRYSLLIWVVFVCCITFYVILEEKRNKENLFEGIVIMTGICFIFILC
jgi:cytochrome c biogenesis factor